MYKGHFQRRELLTALALAPAIPALSGCATLMPPSYRFRMTAEVTTPQGIVRGASVYRVQGKTIFVWEARRGLQMFGEALIIPLKNGAILIPVSGPNGGPQYGINNFAHRALIASLTYVGDDPFKPQSGDSFAEIRAVDKVFSTTKAILNRIAGSSDYELATAPGRWMSSRLSMVWFDDIHDPTSCRWMEAEALSVDRITLETTSARVSNDIGSKLPWLDMPWSGSGYERWWKSEARSRDGSCNLPRMAFSFTG